MYWTHIKWKKSFYINGVEVMTNVNLKSGIYLKCQNKALICLRLFQDFLQRNFKNFVKYEKMKPKVNQPVILFSTANFIILITWNTFFLKNSKSKSIM